MKKILLSAVLCLICTLQVSAQTFDEEMLEGTWELQTNGVDYNDYIGSIKKLVIGDLADKEKKDIRHWSGFIEYNWTQRAKDLNTEYSLFEIEDEDYILDYFITGNDRLHIIVGDDFTLHFKILKLTANTMKLRTKKGEITFQKTVTSVQNAKVEAPIAEQARYNIKGEKVNHPVKGINIVRMTDNSTRKEVVK